jgi:hypothetical protein
MGQERLLLHARPWHPLLHSIRLHLAPDPSWPQTHLHQDPPQSHRRRLPFPRPPRYPSWPQTHLHQNPSQSRRRRLQQPSWPPRPRQSPRQSLHASGEPLSGEALGVQETERPLAVGRPRPTQGLHLISPGHALARRVIALGCYSLPPASMNATLKTHPPAPAARQAQGACGGGTTNSFHVI